WLTVCVLAADVLVVKLLSLALTAVIVWLPTERAVVDNVAVPLAKVVVPSVVLPSRNVTAPVGVPAPGATALTVAVKVTDWPNTDGLEEEVTVVALLAWLTVTSALPVIELVTMSVLVTVWLPAVLSVTPFVKVCTPASPLVKV